MQTNSLKLSHFRRIFLGKLWENPIFIFKSAEILTSDVGNIEKSNIAGIRLKQIQPAISQLGWRTVVKLLTQKAPNQQRSTNGLQIKIFSPISSKSGQKDKKLDWGV